MSDDLSSPELPQVEPDLGRRVAWGLLAGRSRVEIARAEDLTLEECRAVCAAPGMFAVLSI